MCNLAGYVGNRRAAPILIEMLRRQEGLCCGYYTGIATIHEGKVYSAKVVGGIDRLLAETNAADLPGTVGIIHSRTKSGGDVEWGHPFLSTDGNIAVVINGVSGKLCPQELRNAMAQSLFDEGYPFRTRIENALGPYPVLSDGSCVHCSEVLTFLTERKHRGGLAPMESVRQAFSDFPLECATLALFADLPDAIVISRRNFPLMMGRTKDETYLASTCMAFPEDVNFLSVAPVPVMSAGAIRAGECTLVSLDPAEKPVCEIDAAMLARAKEVVLGYLDAHSNEPTSLLDIENSIKELFPKDQLSQEWMLIYETVRPLLRSGELRMCEKTVEGAFPGLTARVMMISKANANK